MPEPLELVKLLAGAIRCYLVQKLAKTHLIIAVVTMGDIRIIGAMSKF